ncbi:alpha-tocopherol transfer protein-like [Haematobia irritans]|uniref:alpha-tocopherol transfer protein-like n=1 Tax=Haematobia irritans TaxID=7368 RepID=UPI003F505BE2
MANIKPLCEKLQKIANKELSEDSSKIQESLHKLNKLIREQHDLKARMDDQFLVQFLRACKYDENEAKEKVLNFYTLKSSFPESFGVVNVDAVKFREMHDIGCVSVLPTPLNDFGPRIVVYRYLYSPDKYTMEEIIAVCEATLETFILNDPYACVSGVAYLLDMAKLTPGHLRQYTSNVLKKLAAFYEKALPLNSKCFCFMNVPEGAEDFFQQYLYSLSPEFRKKIFICGKNLYNIEEVIPRKYLPQEYGGDNGCMENLVKDFNQVFDHHREYFKQNAQYGIDKNLRPNKAISLESSLQMGVV